MMKTLMDLQIRVRSNTLDWRSLDYFVNTYKFTKGWELANEDERKHIEEVIKKCDIDLIKRLINRIIRKDIGEKSLQELRELASVFGIPHYGRYSKLKLYQLIKEKSNNEKG